MKRFLNSITIIILCLLFIGLGKTIKSISVNFFDENKLIYEITDSSITKESSSGEVIKELETSGDYVSVAIELVDNFKENEDEPSDISSVEDAQEFVRKQRECVKAHYTRENELIAKNLNLRFLEADLEISEYSNFIFLNYKQGSFEEFHLNHFKNIAKDHRVSNVYIRSKDTTKTTQELYALKSKIYVNPFIANNPEWDGSGINVGVLDSGIIDENHPSFADTELLIRDEWWYWETVGVHPTSIALTIGGSSGIAPGAKILSVEFFLTWSGPVEWLLNNGANIINISICSGSTHGNYNSDAAYLDNIARNNCVLIVGSAGNRGGQYTDCLITSPKTGYNVITVGDTDSLGRISYSSSYKTNFLTSKPNLTAPTELLELPGFNNYFSGTSYASAMVSGVSAVIMQQNYVCLIRPHVLGALLAATATPNYYHDTFESSGYEEKVGAGWVNLEAAFTNYRAYCFYNGSNRIGQVVNEQQFFLHAGMRTKVAFFNMANTGGATHNKATDYDIYLKDEYGLTVGYSHASYGNMELIECIIPTSGYYYVRIVQFGNKAGTERDYCAFSVWQTDPDFSSVSPVTYD